MIICSTHRKSKVRKMRILVPILLMLFTCCRLFCNADNPNSTTTSSTTPTTTTEGPDESGAMRKLRQDLLVTRQYDKASRPVKNHNSQTKVDMRITINEFVDFDTAGNFLVTDAWFHVSWKDEFLSWDPSEYQNLKQVHFSANEIWKPDIVLINSAHQYNYLNLFTDSELIVTSGGEVLWITMGMLYSKCPIWAFDYPFTVKPLTCSLTFCSLIYESHEVNITTQGKDFYNGGPWYVNPRLLLYSFDGERYEKTYESYGAYSFLTLNVKLKRLSNALPLLIRVPTLVSVLMVLVTFFIPSTWSVRIHLSMMAIFIQLILILYIGFQLGPNAIGLARPVSYLRADLFLSCTALVLTLVFRRLLALADILPTLPYVASSLLSGPLSKLLCFGINHNEYIVAQNSTIATKSQPSRFANLSAPSASSSLVSRAAATILPTSLINPTSSVEHAALVNEDSASINNFDYHNGIRTAADRSTSIAIGNDGHENGEAWVDGNIAAQSSGRQTNMIVITSSQFEWMQLIVFCDRVMFALYAVIMLPRLF